MEINVKYLKGEFTNDTRRLNAKLGDIVRNLQAIKVPKNEPVCGVTGQPDCKGKIDHIMDMINGGTTAGGVESAGLCSTLSAVVEEVNEMVNGYEWAENYAMNASINLNVDTTYAENSMGGGNKNTIREDNIYASMDDTFKVKYIAIYADGKYMYNMILNDENKDQSIDSKIAELKASGVIPEGANIKLSMGITKEQPDGSLGDIGWLPQVDYNPDTRTSGIEKTSDRQYKKITSEKYENQDGFIGPTMPDEVRTGDYGINYDTKFTPLDQVFYDESGREINLANYLTNLEKSIEDSNNKNGEKRIYRIASYSGGVYQNDISQDYDGGMSKHNIEKIRKNLDTDLIRDGMVPHITVITTTIGKDGSRKDESKILFLDKRDITLPEDRIDLMVTNTGKNYTGAFVNRKDLATGELSFSGDNIDEMIEKTDTIKVTDGRRTVRFDSDDDNVKEKIEEYVKAYQLANPDGEIKIIGHDEGKGLFNLEDTYTSTVTIVNGDEYLDKVRSLEKQYGEIDEFEDMRNSYNVYTEALKSDKEYLKFLEDNIEDYKENMNDTSLSQENRDTYKKMYEDSVKEIKLYKGFVEHDKDDLARAKAKISNYEPDEERLAKLAQGDYNEDGEVNIADTVLDMKHDAGI